MTSRLPVVGVMGSATESHAALAVPLGAWLATLPVHLLTRGGSGVMQEVSRVFASVHPREGRIIGILPAAEAGSPLPRSGYPNAWVEIAVFTHLHLVGERGRDPLSRNHINVLSSDLIVALPGGTGTASEVLLALAYNRPVIAFLESRSQIPGLPDQVPSTPALAEVKTYVTSHLRLGASMAPGSDPPRPAP